MSEFKILTINDIDIVDPGYTTISDSISILTGVEVELSNRINMIDKKNKKYIWRNQRRRRR